MTGIWITPDRVFDGVNLRSGLSLRVEGNRTVALSDQPQQGVRLPGCLSAGFIDLQVNGGGGVMLNSTPTRAGICTIAAAHRGFGTAGILPTVITDRPEVLDAAAQAVMDARDDPGILGLHIEGPHISLARRGTHDARYLRPMDQRTLDLVRRLRSQGITVMITLAPEAATPAQITELAQMGAIVSIGHTDAQARDVMAALQAGASCGTHLFNAMSQMQSRAPGAVGAILTRARHFGLICDGIHVDDQMIDLALQVDGEGGRAFLVSDAMATVGGPDHFDLYGQRITVQDGRLINAEGNLAGAHLTQSRGVARLVQVLGLPLARALRLAITVPSQVIGRDELSGVLDRSTDDMIMLDSDLTPTALGDVLRLAGVA